MKVAINKAYGGFGLSKEAYEYMGIPWDGYGYDFNDDDKRTDPKLIECIEKLGERASRGGNVKIVNVPDGAEFEIYDYDGYESVETPRKEWG